MKRALDRSGLPVVKSAGGRALIPSSTYQQLARRLGAVPEVAGLTRQEALVLAVLNRRPLGLTSARAAAEGGGISPTSAGRALAHLRDLGYVSQGVEKLVEGKAVARPIWRIRRSGASWQQVASLIRQVVPPQTKAQTGKLPRRVPGRLAHLFWNADLRKVQLPRDARYVAGRILTSNDTQALAWMTRSLPPKAIVEASQARGMDKRMQALAQNLARSQ